MAIKTYKDGTPFTGVIGRTTEESSAAWPEPPRPPEGAPNVLFFVLDDVGYGQANGDAEHQNLTTARSWNEVNCRTR